jgi:hypothetical protein
LSITRSTAPVELGHRHVDDACKARPCEQQPGEGGEVARARVVGGIVEADRVGVTGVVETELAGALVHLRHKGLARAREVLRDRRGGVVGALEEERLEQVLDRHPLAGSQIDPRLRRQGVVRRRREDLPRTRALEREQGGHQLGRARDRPARVGPLGEHDLAVAAVDDDRSGSRADVGRTLRGGAGGHGGSERSQRDQRQ